MLIFLGINTIVYNTVMLDIEQFETKIGKKSRLLGLDPGRKRIGIAICDENKIVATPYTTIIKNKFSDLLNALNKIINENNIEGVVIGNPINMDGSAGPSSQSAKDLSINLSKNISVPITLWDERLSSQGSFNIMKDLDINSSSKRETLDRNAAAFILQGFLDFLNK